jgi:hypothetical protein
VQVIDLTTQEASEGITDMLKEVYLDATSLDHRAERIF